MMRKRYRRPRLTFTMLKGVAGPPGYLPRPLINVELGMGGRVPCGAWPLEGR